METIEADEKYLARAIAIQAQLDNARPSIDWQVQFEEGDTGPQDPFKPCYRVTASCRVDGKDYSEALLVTDHQDNELEIREIVQNVVREVDNSLNGINE